MKEVKNNKIDHSVKLFTTSYIINDHVWSFEMRRYHTIDPRFEGVLTQDGHHVAEFVMVRSSTGMWLLSGDALPHEILEHVQEIGKAFEEESSR